VWGGDARTVLPVRGRGNSAHPPSRVPPWTGQSKTALVRRFLRGRTWPLHASDLVLVEQSQGGRFAGEIGQSLPTGLRYLHRMLPSEFF